MLTVEVPWNGKYGKKSVKGEHREALDRCWDPGALPSLYVHQRKEKTGWNVANEQDGEIEMF
jgi:hypothetical protein